MFERAIIVLADGLRADVVTPSCMPSLYALAAGHTRAVDARTVTPSVTVAAMASLATGVEPAIHGLEDSPLRGWLRLSRVRPVARELAQAGLPVTIVAGELPLTHLPVAHVMASLAGTTELVLRGGDAGEIAAAARRALNARRNGLTLVYLPDPDRAGHEYGWMSDPYLEAAERSDAAIADLVVDIDEDDLLIVLSDHGGGGVEPRDHDLPHPLNSRIPLVLAGGNVRRRVIDRPVSLLDVPATVLWALGLPVPAGYQGRVLEEAFAPVQRVGGRR